MLKIEIAIGTFAGGRTTLIDERLKTKKYEVTKEENIIIYEICLNEWLVSFGIHDESRPMTGGCLHLHQKIQRKIACYASLS